MAASARHIDWGWPLMKQNGVEVGQNRLFEWLADGFDEVRRAEHAHAAMESGLMEIKERTISNPDGA